MGVRGYRRRSRGRFSWKTAAFLAVVLAAAWWKEQADQRRYAGGGEGRYPATCVEVVDGDTLVVDWAERRGDRVRLLGVDAMETHNLEKQQRQASRLGRAPETVAALGQAGAAWMRRRALRREVELVFPGEEIRRDPYRRLLCYVEVGGQDLGAGLVADGLAETRREPHPRKSTYAGHARAARDARAGLFQKDPASALR